MKTIILLLCSIALLSTSGCIFRRDHDHGGYSEHGHEGDRYGNHDREHDHDYDHDGDRH